MAPILVDGKVQPDCVLVKQPEVKVEEIKGPDCVLYKPDIPVPGEKAAATKTSHTETKSGKITTTTTTTSTSTSYSGWKYTGARESRTFDCEFPTTNPNVNRVLEPLPFPKKLSQIIAWTDAFVDRIAIMTAEQERQTHEEVTRFTKEIEEYQITITRGIEKIREQDKVIAEERRKVADRDCELETIKSESEKKSVTIKELEKKIETLKVRHAEEIRGWMAENTKDDKEIAEKKEHIRRDHEKLVHEIKAREEVESKLRVAETKVASRDTAIRSLHSEIKRLTTEISGHLHKIRGLESDIRIEVESHNGTRHKYHVAMESIDKLKKELAAALAKAAEIVKKHEKDRGEFDGKVKDFEKTIREIKIVKEKLEVEIKTITTELTTTKKTITTIEKEKHDNSALWKERLDTAERERKDEERDLNARLDAERRFRSDDQAEFDAERERWMIKQKKLNEELRQVREFLDKEKKDSAREIASVKASFKSLESAQESKSSSSTTVITSEEDKKVTTGTTIKASGSSTTTTTTTS